jgi:hypothetical protein
MNSGAIALDLGDFPAARNLSIDACKASASDGWRDPYTIYAAERNICAIRSLDGDHKGALGTLERIFPLVRALESSNPFVLFDYLNSLAVEMMAAGRLEEATNAIRIAMASPYASAYPEWHETRNDILIRTRRPSRSVVAITGPLVVPVPSVCPAAADELESSDSVAAQAAGVAAPLRSRVSASTQLFPSREEHLARCLALPSKVIASEVVRISHSQRRLLAAAYERVPVIAPTSRPCLRIGARGPPLPSKTEPQLPGHPVRGPPVIGNGLSLQLLDPSGNNVRVKSSCLPGDFRSAILSHTPRVDSRPRGPPLLL